MEIVSAERIGRIAQSAADYVCDHIGDCVSVGTPLLNRQTHLWSARVYATTDYGSLYAGDLVLDESGAVTTAPERSAMEERVSRMIRALDNEFDTSQSDASRGEPRAASAPLETKRKALARSKGTRIRGPKEPVPM